MFQPWIPTGERSGLLTRIATMESVSLCLSISDSGRSQVDARVEVQGGRPPYTYLWAGSNPAARSNTGPSINYTPIVRAVPGSNSEFRPGETFPVRERVTVTVIDANGVMMQTGQVVAVNAHPVSIEKGKTASYGCQSPRDWDFMVDRTGWEDGMGTAGAGGGTQEYSWSADLSWPGDFIEPVPPGSLPATPWVNGDADYSNWGVNSAAIVLNNTDGAPDWFDANEPGATTADYGSAQLWSPATAGNNVFVKAGGFNVSYNGAWGPNGPNDNLLWLAQDCCDLLDATDGGGLTTDQRWGAAFGGLHIMTGFSTTEQVGDGSFEKDFAQNMLGVSGPAQKVFDAWFNAATTAGIGHGAAAAMGPIGMGGVTDKDDYYIGKGSRGPSLTGAGITGWWYVSQ